MSIILAAIDATTAGRPDLETAIRIGELTNAPVEAVHVADGTTGTVEALTERAPVSLRQIADPAEGTWSPPSTPPRSRHNDAYRGRAARPLAESSSSTKKK
jgi:nucleotide-binding universal stress UspA family protein